MPDWIEALSSIYLNNYILKKGFYYKFLNYLYIGVYLMNYLNSIILVIFNMGNI